MTTEKKTVVNEIWEEIKNLHIDLYALPNKTVEDCVSMKPIPGDVLFLKPKVPAALTALESALGKKYVVGTTEVGLITVEKVAEVPTDDDEYVYYQRRGKVEKIRRKDLLG
jgi:hypothetical protein